ncbi:TPA: LPD38 domain-containing protein [Haemophilus influenzae]
MSFYLSEKAYNQIIGNTSKSKEESTPYLGIETTPVKPEQQGIIGDVVDSVQMGAWKGLSDLAHGLGAITGADWLHKAGDLAAKGADENMATMSDEMKSALNQSALDGEGKGIANIRWWAGNLGSILGQNLDTVLTLGFGKVATIGVKQAGKMLLKREAAEQVGKIAVEQAAKRGVPQKYLDMVGYTAIQTAMSGGSRYGQKRDEVMAMDNETLAKLPEFSNAYYEIADSDEGKDKTVEELYSLAKTRFADKVGQSAALNPTAIMTDIGVNAISGLGGGFKGLLSPAQTVKGGLVKGALIEGGTEAVQGVAEQYALNQAQKDYIDPNKDLTEGMADNAINGAVLGGVFGSAMGGLDAHSERSAFNKQKRVLLNHIDTGNEAVDSQLRNYVDMLNQGATELSDLVSASRVQALNNAGIINARARQAAEDALAQQQAKAKFESDFFGEETQQAQDVNSAFQVDPKLERALELHSILGQFRNNNLSRANEFMDTPMVFDNVQAKKDYVIGRAFDEVRNIAQSYGIDPQDGKAMRQWLEDYAEKAKEYGENQPHFNTPTNNLQSEANIAPTSREGVIEGVSDEIDVGNGNYQPFQYEVVDATTLSPTQQKDDNQFRDRDRTASQSQINNIARNLDPRKLAASPTMDIGAPLLALDGKTIIAGNGRSMALRQAYQEGGAEGYRQFLKDNADRFGVDSAQLDAVENPVLVRRLTSPVDIAQVAINSNEQGGMRMSELEQAKVDARRLPSMDSFVADEHSEINSTDNQQFIRQFIQNQPENLRNELLDSKGNLSQTGVQRIRNAMLYQAYGDSQTLSRLIENTDQGAKNVLNALTALAPKVAQTQQDINSGVLSDVSISHDIIQAVEKYNQLNAQGYKINDYLAQDDFVGDLSPEAREILTIFDENRRSGKRIAQVLGAYFDQAKTQGNLSQASIFGDMAFDKLGSLQQAKNVDEDIRLSLNESADSDFAKAVDKIASGEAVAKYINVGTTPSVLKILGLPDVRVTISGQVLNKVMRGKHNVTQETLKQLPNQINNPVAVMKSSTQENGYVVLTELVEWESGKDKPVIAALHLKKTNQGLELISIASVYGRSNTQIQRGLERDLLYWNKAKGSQFLTAFGLRLPSHMQSDVNLSALNIKTEADLSQYQSAKNNQETQINPEIQRAQDILRKNLGKAAEHIEVITFANPPKDVKNLITSDVEGWFNPKTGKVTLIADTINATKTMSKEERLQFVAWHEMAHRGINVGYKGTYDRLMAKVGENKVVSQIADAIQVQRKNTDDLAATNRAVAIEEAIAEVMAAHETGKWNELESRYGVEIKKGQRQSTKSWLAMTAQRIKEFLSKIFGAERAAQFSDEDVLNLVAKIKESAVGELNENGDVRFSRNEELTKEHYNQAKGNGETELTFHQWKQVRSPEFKAWFGDWENDPENSSKVVNERTGEPLVAYHGTGSEFNVFDKNKAGAGNDKGLRGKGFYFSPNRTTSESYGEKIIGAYVSLKNPFRPSDFTSAEEVAEHLINKLSEQGYEDYTVDPFIFNVGNSFSVRSQYAGAFSSILKDAGYDGILYPNRQEIVAFDSNQIKSATDNTGAFSKENDDIRFSRAQSRSKAESLEKLREAETIRISGREIEPSEDFRQYRRNAMEYGKTLRGSYVNEDTGREISLGRAGVTEVLHHDISNPEHLQSIAAIPQIIENSTYIDTLPNEDLVKNPDIKEYEYYIAGLNIGGSDYTVRASVGIATTGDKYYDHKLTKIEKGDLLEMTSRLSSAEISNQSPLFDVNDKRLLQILQDAQGESDQQIHSDNFKRWFGNSKVVDENGNPLVVYHGSNANFTIFDKSKIDIDNLGASFYFSSEDIANSYANRRTQERGGKENTYAVYLKMEKPLDFRNVTHEQAVEANKQEFLSFGFDEAEAQRQAEELLDGFIADTKRFNEKTDFAIALPDNKSEGMQSFIKNEGIDGFIVPGRDKASGKDGVAYVVFEPHQIKSATNNNGDFSSENADIRFSRANTAQSALDLSQTAKAKSEPSFWDDLKAKDYSSFKERFNQVVGKVDEWFADSLRPVNDWIDSMHLEDQTGNTSSRDHEKRRLKDAMYTAKGKRDALNSELEQAYLKPILSKIAALSKETKKSKRPIDELTMKRLVGNWISARYSIKKNIDLLNRDEKVMRDTKRLLDNAKQNGTSTEVRRLNEAYLKAKEQYDNRKADIYNTDYKNKGNRFKVGVAGGWSIPEAELIMKNTEQRISKSNLESIAEMVYDLNQARLDIDRASGRYTEKEYQEYKANRHYVPLTGDPNADVDIDIISGAGSNALNITRDKALKGRINSEAEDAIDAVWKSIGKSTTYAGFAEFKAKIDDLFETEVALLKNKGYSDTEAREQATANLGISKRKMQGLTRSSDNVLIRKEGSDYYEYELPTQTMESLGNDNVEHANAFLKVISKPTGWYARGVTQWTVTFAPMNMLRDTWEKSEFIRVQKLYDKNNRLVDSKTMDKIGRDTIKNALTDKEVWNATKRLGFGQELRDSVPVERMLKQLLREGGISNYGTYLDKSEVDLIKKLRKENNPIASKLEKAGKILEGYNKTFDTVSALASYKALIENGIDPKQAAATTLELTNFRKTGSKMRGIKALYMFSQPTVMGAANLMRYLSTRKGQIRFIGYMAVMTSLYTVLRSMDDEDEGGNKMDQLGDITRYIPIPLGEGKYFKIPVGFGMAQMAWNFSTNIVKGAVGDISLTEAGANMLVHSLKTFSPVSPSEISAAKYPMEKIALTATPTILQPIMQNVVNRSAFGNKITTNYVRDDKLKAEQSKATTAQFWKDVAINLNDTMGIDMHPEQIKNLFDGYSSMLGSLKELNTVFVENPNREELGRKARTPFLNQFIGTTNEFAIQSRYYEASEEAGSVYKEYKSRKERNELGNWLDAEKMKLIKFHEQEESIVKKARSEKANLTRALRSGKISAIAYENGIKRYNKDMSRVQAKMLRKYRIMEGLNTN